ncbi:MAG: ankyrin repeat domain-containing protein [Syntrophales bacterium]|nr:ankyrin repeat domain-containing protein [Syntrophales bacterium]
MKKEVNSMGGVSVIRRASYCFISISALLIILISIANTSAGDLEDKLVQAAREGRVDDVNALIAKGADVNGKDGNKKINKYSPLMVATENGHAEAVRVLLAKGADINYKIIASRMVFGNDWKVSRMESEDVTALTLALKKGRKDIINMICIPSCEDAVYRKNNLREGVTASQCLKAFCE